jgi:hypothetical protein
MKQAFVEFSSTKDKWGISNLYDRSLCIHLITMNSRGIFDKTFVSFTLSLCSAVNSLGL